MKVIIAGCRDIFDYSLVLKAIEKSGFTITEVVSGAARGVDSLGEKWASENGIPIKRFPANWKKFENSAGMIRNTEMANYGDALIAVWDNKSRGTKGMIDIATRKGLKVFVLNTQDAVESKQLTILDFIGE